MEVIGNESNGIHVLEFVGVVRGGFSVMEFMKLF